MVHENEKVTVLFLAANPRGTERLSLDEEIRSITDKIRASEGRDALNLVSAWAVRPDDLLQKLNEHKPHIVHFSGHGVQAGEIVLVDSNGSPKSVSSDALKALFKTLRDNIQVVILNACYSKIQAESIAEIIDCVIGMNATIADQAAIVFAASFYRAIGFGRSVQEAFEQGKVALLFEGKHGEGIPELLYRQGVDPSKIILCKTQPKKPDYSQVQTMVNSPGSIQVGRDLHVNTSRSMTQDAVELMIDGLKKEPCQITIGALGLGGEPSQLADELLHIIQRAGCKANGVFHGVNLGSFYGVRILYSPIKTPVESIRIIKNALEASKIEYFEFPDPNQKPESVYLYIGYKP